MIDRIVWGDLSAKMDSGDRLVWHQLLPGVVSEASPVKGPSPHQHQPSNPKLHQNLASKPENIHFILFFLSTSQGALASPAAAVKSKNDDAPKAKSCCAKNKNNKADKAPEASILYLYNSIASNPQHIIIFFKLRKTFTIQIQFLVGFQECIIICTKDMFISLFLFLGVNDN